MGDGRQVQQRVGAAGDGGVHHDRVLDGVHGDDIAGPQPAQGQLHGLDARLMGIAEQVGAVGGHQRAAGEGQPQGLRHDLHGGRCADEAARAAAGTGVLLGPAQAGFVDLAALVFGGVHAQLLQRQQFRPGAHGAAGHHHRRAVHPGQAHQGGGHALVAGGDEHPAVKGRGAGVNLNHARDHLTAGQAEVDAVGALAFPVADVRAVVARAEATGLSNALPGGLHQLIQMSAAGVAVAEGALDHDLRLGEILALPAGAQAKGIHFRRKSAHFLAD